MIEYTTEQLESFEFYLIGDEDREDYYPAIIGIAKDRGHVAYSFEKLVDCYVRSNNWTREEATEWVEYNVERALPYYGATAPVILNTNTITDKNKKYDPCKVVLD